MGFFDVNPALPALPKTLSFAGKSILITGANSGIGFEFTRQLLLRKASIIYIAVRTLEKGEETRKTLLRDPAVQKSNPNAVIKPYELDLSKYSSVLSFCKKFSTEVQTLDLAVMNAGAGIFKFDILPTGNETMLQVNFLSTALLSLHLLPILQRGSTPDHPSHLTFVGSIGAHKTSWEKEPFRSPPKSVLETLNQLEAYPPLERYGMSKLFVHMWARELATKVSSQKVVINYVCPSFTNSSIDRGLPFYLRPLVGNVRKIIGRTPEQGAIAYMMAATGPVEGHGCFYSDGIVAEYVLGI
jgi:NAD(P)-dependent dehydrogenase (short-subunit alcohol dehydrogenase family)